ncbi:MAG: glycosyltransferase family 4 protein [Alphaproteobacteria bacterium]|nr:glycosyltransferase family 4 protein [Alphaproteobacteria bacterium]
MSTLPIIYAVDAARNVTGSFTSLRNFAQALRESARIVLVLPEDHAIPPSELTGFWRVETLPIYAPSKRVSVLRRYVPALLISGWKLRRMMQRDHATRLLLNDFYILQGAMMRLFYYQGLIITWVRCEPRRFAGPLARPILAVVRATSDHMVAVSQFIRSILPAAMQPEVIYNIYQGRTRQHQLWTNGPKRILYVGNYIAGKGQDMGLEAFAIAAQDDPDLELHFYGSDMGLAKNSEYRNALNARAEQLGMSHRVTFGGFVADTFPLLESAYMSLNCSVSESFSRTVLEASGAGVAVIATQSGGPQEIIREGETGYLIPVGDVNACAARIAELARDPAKTARMGEASAAHIAQHFSAQTILNRLKDLLKL